VVDVMENSESQTPPLLKVDNLHIRFLTEKADVHVVDGLSFHVRAGETLGIVGESGSGKSVTNLSLLRLLPSPPAQIVADEISFQGRDLMGLSQKEMRSVRGREIAMIFQDPMTSLNPFMRISDQLEEVLEIHDPGPKPAWHALLLRPLLSLLVWMSNIDIRALRWMETKGPLRAISQFALNIKTPIRDALIRYRDPGAPTRRKRCVEMLEQVGIPDAGKRIEEYPHQFSGGMRQRVMVAMALLCKPKLLIADEPTTALDVTIQAQILELIRSTRENDEMSVILVTHDLGVVAGMTDRVMVMYAGKTMEVAETTSLFETPSHPYTLGLLRCLPRMDEEMTKTLYSIEGAPPDLSARTSGCPFAPRCEYAQDRCHQEFPDPVEVSPGHISYCWYVEEVRGAQEGRTT
jgi:peptide/nickel transport system ATP-binding protein